MVNFNARVYTKAFELPRSELSLVIADNVIGNAKHVHNFFDELHHLSRCNGSGRLYFDPLCEFIHYDEDVCESTFNFLERTYQVQPPSGERPGNRYGLQLMRWHVFLVSKKTDNLHTDGLRSQRRTQ
jgi:hypothetical protein